MHWEIQILSSYGEMRGRYSFWLYILIYDFNSSCQCDCWVWSWGMSVHCPMWLRSNYWGQQISIMHTTWDWLFTQMFNTSDRFHLTCTAWCLFPFPELSNWIVLTSKSHPVMTQIPISSLEYQFIVWSMLELSDSWGQELSHWSKTYSRDWLEAVGIV